LDTTLKNVGGGAMFHKREDSDGGNGEEEAELRDEKLEIASP